MPRPLIRTSHADAQARIYINDPLEDSGESGMTSSLTSYHAPFSRLSYHRHKETRILCTSYCLILFLSDTLSLSSFFFFSQTRGFLPKRISANTASFLFSPAETLSLPRSHSSNFQLSALFRRSGAAHLSWFRTNYCRIENDKDKRGTGYIKR